jgi:chromosome segregation ATPase
MSDTKEQQLIPEQSSTIESNADENKTITAKISDSSPKMSSIFSNRPTTRSKNNNLNSTPAINVNELTDDSDDSDNDDDNILDYVTDNNDRFANIIERMDLLERENALLKQQREHEQSRNRNHIHETYEQEIAESRRLLDELAGEKATKDIECSRLLDQVKDLDKEKSRLSAEVRKLEKNLETEKNVSQTRLSVSQKLRRDLDALTKSYVNLEAGVKDMQTEKVKAQTERDVYETESFRYKTEMNLVSEKYHALEIKAEEMKARIDQLQKSVESEATQRVETQNKLQSLQEELEFQAKIHKQELQEFGVGNYSKSSYDITQDQRFQHAIQEMRNDYDNEQANILARLKHQHEARFSSLELENQRLREQMYERDAGLKNAEMTANIDSKTMKRTVSELKMTLSSKEAELEIVRKQLASAMSEKEKLNIDLMSRKEVWTASERKLSLEIKELSRELETKTIVESQLRSELANFRTMMQHAEQRHQMKSPSNNKLAKRRKRRVSQISSSSVTGMTPQTKKFPKEGKNMSTILKTPELSRLSDIADDTNPPESVSEEKKECTIM